MKPPVPPPPEVTGPQPSLEGVKLAVQSMHSGLMQLAHKASVHLACSVPSGTQRAEVPDCTGSGAV
jgi:hypothetical protein